MKFHLIAIAFLATLVFTACNTDKRKSFEEPVAYNDYVVDCITSIDTAYALAIEIEGGMEAANRTCDSLILVCDANVSMLERIQPYDGDSTFTEAAKKFAYSMKKMANGELRTYHKLFNDYTNAKVEEADKIGDELNKVAEGMDKRYEVEMNRIDAVQKKLAKKLNYIVMPG